MKTLFKISSVLVLCSLVALPLLAFAQGGSTECCKVKVRINLTGMGITTTDGATLNEVAADTIVGVGTKCILTPGATESDVNKQTTGWGLICLLNTIYNVTNWVFVILMAIVVIMIIVGGFFMVTAAGAEDRLKQGKTMITYAIIGLVVALVAKWIPSLVRFVIG